MSDPFGSDPFGLRAHELQRSRRRLRELRSERSAAEARVVALEGKLALQEQHVREAHEIVEHVRGLHASLEEERAAIEAVTGMYSGDLAASIEGLLRGHQKHHEQHHAREDVLTAERDVARAEVARLASLLREIVGSEEEWQRLGAQPTHDALRRERDAAAGEVARLGVVVKRLQRVARWAAYLLERWPYRGELHPMHPWIGAIQDALDVLEPGDMPEES